MAINVTDIAKTLYSFWSGFGIPAYPENGVPDEAKLPYITYSINMPEWKEETIVNARVWYRDTSLQAISAKIDEISSAIGEGVSLSSQNGCVYLFKDSNFVQFQPSEAMVEMKVAYLTLILHAI